MKKKETKPISQELLFTRALKRKRTKGEPGRVFAKRYNAMTANEKATVQKAIVGGSDGIKRTYFDAEDKRSCKQDRRQLASVSNYLAKLHRQSLGCKEAKESSAKRRKRAKIVVTAAKLGLSSAEYLAADKTLRQRNAVLLTEHNRSLAGGVR